MNNSITELTQFLINNFPSLSFIVILFIIASFVVKHLIFHPIKFLEKSTANFISSLFQFIILFSLIPFILWYYQFDQLKIWAFIAIISTAATIAIVSKIRDLFAGIFIYLMNYYRIDEKVTLNSIKGKVIEFNVFNTVIQTREGDIITLSNSDIADKTVINHTKSGFQRIVIALPISNYSDRSSLKKLIISALQTFDFIINKDDIEIYTRFDGTQEYWDLHLVISTNADVVKCKGNINNLLMQIEEVHSAVRIVNYYERNS